MLPMILDKGVIEVHAQTCHERQRDVVCITEPNALARYSVVVYPS